MRLSFLLIPFSILCGAAFFTMKHLTKVEYHAADNVECSAAADNPQSPHRILFVATYKNIGGGEIHAIAFYKELIKKGYPIFFLTAQDSALKNELTKNNIPFYTCNLFKISGWGNCWQPGLEKAISALCKIHNITIIHCNGIRNTIAARKIAAQLPPIKVVYTHHMTEEIPLSTLKQIDGIVGVSPELARRFDETKNKHALNNLQTICITPFFNEEKFLTFKPTRSREEFFQQEFEVTLKPLPLICMIANLNPDLLCKNHPLLLKAMQKLIYEKRRPIQVALAGDGPRKKYLQDLAKSYNIQDYVHFLGRTTQTPELIFHSDIQVLTSGYDAFPIVVLEGALMKKPIIIPTKIGSAGTLIRHNHTGLLFENNNVDDFVAKLETLLDNPELGKTLGENAYHYAVENFSNTANMKKLASFYDAVQTLGSVDFSAQP